MNTTNWMNYVDGNKLVSPTFVGGGCVISFAATKSTFVHLEVKP